MVYWYTVTKTSQSSASTNILSELSVSCDMLSWHTVRNSMQIIIWHMNWPLVIILFKLLLVCQKLHWCINWNVSSEIIPYPNAMHVRSPITLSYNAVTDTVSQCVVTDTVSQCAVTDTLSHCAVTDSIITCGIWVSQTAVTDNVTICCYWHHVRTCCHWHGVRTCCHWQCNNLLSLKQCHKLKVLSLTQCHNVLSISLVPLESVTVSECR